MDTTKMKCPHCGKGVKVPAEHIGRRGRCPHCEQILLLQPPDDSSAAAPVTHIIVESPPANESLVAALNEHTAALREWSSQMGELRTSVSGQLAALSEQLATVQDRLAGAVAKSLAEERAAAAEARHRHVEEIRTLRSEAAKDQADVSKQLAALQATLVQQWEAVAKSFTDSTSHAQDQFALMRQGQLESAQDVVSAMAKELQAAQQGMLDESRGRIEAVEAALAKQLKIAHEHLAAESQNRIAAQSASLEEIVIRAGEAIASMSEQSAALPGQLAAALQACSADLHRQAESAATGAAQAFGQQITSLSELRTAMQKDVQTFLGQMQDLRAAQGKILGEAVEAAKESARAIQEQVAVQQAQSASDLAKIAADISQRLDGSTRQLAELQQSFGATASRAMEDLEKVRNAADQAGQDRRERMSAEAQKVLSEVYVRSEQVLRQSWQLGSQAVAQQEAKLSAISERIVASLAQTQQAMARPLATLSELAQKLAPFEKSLTQSWETLAATDAFRKTLASIDQTLVQLNSALQNNPDRLDLAGKAES